VLKPSPKAPLCAHLFVEAVLDGGTPDGALNTLFGDAVAPGLVSDSRVDFVSFTASIPVGKIIRRSIGMKRSALELGGVGPTFVHHDADLEAAATACARNSMLLADQSFVSVQNVFVERSVYDAFLERASAGVRSIRFGDPMNPATEVGIGREGPRSACATRSPTGSPDGPPIREHATLRLVQPTPYPSRGLGGLSHDARRGLSRPSARYRRTRSGRSPIGSCPA
jgi:Aldehyde dehydrogenase family